VRPARRVRPPAADSIGEEGAVPDWVEHAVWWHVYPLGFVGAEHEAASVGAAGAHRLGQLRSWLDYAVDLGVSGLALGPVFASGSHGYDTIDHYAIDSRLGDQEDFAALLEAAHARGLRVLLDGVFNHVGRGFPAFRRALDQGPASPDAKWFRLNQPDGSPPGAEPGYATFEGHSGLVALNHGEPAVAEYVIDVMRHWLRAGADGWRLDAAYAVPAEFWASVLPQVRAQHPEAYLVGEVIHGDYAGIVAGAGFDSVTQYELWKAIWSSLNDRNFFELAWALERHNGFLDTFVPFTFTGNHDVTRLASRLKDDRHLAHALAALCTVGGTPAIYYGDEQAFRGVKEDRPGGDDDVRPAFPATPEDLAPDGWPTYRLHQDLIGLRRRHSWLHRARSQVLDLANEHLIYQAAGAGGRLVVALSLSDQPVSRQIPHVRSCLAGQATLSGETGTAAWLSLPPHGWAVFGA
jgi:cyclomaltodextrinase / maltogenic alpha-amylase / neopullulanase